MHLMPSGKRNAAFAMPIFVLLLALFLLLPALSSGAPIASPKLASSAQIILDENGTVYVPGGEMRNLELNLSVPISGDCQQVSASGPVRTDSQGNPFITIKSSNPPNPFSYARRVTLQTKERGTLSLPASYEVTADYYGFILPTARTQSANAQVKALAEQITATAQTPFEKVAKLAAWVRENVEYSSDFVGQEKDALWVMQNKKGVCVEFSTMFAALARSIGIPARYVSGYAYSEDMGGWFGHMWNEAYIGEWVPVDSTWFEVGNLDALHIEASRTREIGLTSYLAANVYPPAAQIEWAPAGKSGAYANNIFVQDAAFSERGTDFDLVAVEPNLAPGGKTLVYFTYEGKDYRSFPVSLAACKGTSSVAVDESDKYVVAEPGKTSVVVWEINASDMLPRNYVYTCPLTLNSPYFEHRAVTITVDPRTPMLPPFTVNLKKKLVSPGDENGVVLSIPDDGRVRTFYVLSEGGVRTQSFYPTSGEISFFSSGLGTVPLYVASTGGGLRKLEYVSKQNKGLAIEVLSLPEALFQGEPARATAFISSDSYPVDVELEFLFAGSSVEARQVKLAGPAVVAFDFTPGAAGAQIAQLIARKDGGVTDEKSALVDVEIAPVLDISDVKVTKDNEGKLYVIFMFSKTGGPLYPKIGVRGMNYRADDGLRLEMPEGDYTITLSWYDSHGNEYMSDGTLSVKAPDGGASSCPLAIGLLAISCAGAFICGSRRNVC